jgi:hypothetical protein
MPYVSPRIILQTGLRPTIRPAYKNAGDVRRRVGVPNTPTSGLRVATKSYKDVGGLPLITDYTMPEPPDLQTLVETYGGCARIPEAAWKLYDMRLSYTQAWLRYHHRKDRSKPRAPSRKKRV